MSEEIVYTPEFFKVREKLVDIRPHKCEQCGIADGARGYNKKGDKKKFPSVVRLCLRDPNGPPNKVWNIAMYCTRCRKPNEVWKTPRRIKPSKLPQLYGAVAEP